jgi:hypothetical protein
MTMTIERQRELGVPDDWRDLPIYPDHPDSEPRTVYQLDGEGFVYNCIVCSVDMAQLLREVLPEYFGPWAVSPTWAPDGETWPAPPEPEPDPEPAPDPGEPIAQQ